jgi:hypothetical protein
MQYIKTLKMVPFLCFVVGIVMNNLKNEITSNVRLIVSLVLLLISLVAIIVVVRNSPRNASTRSQLFLLSAFLILSAVVYLYFLYIKQ